VVAGYCSANARLYRFAAAELAVLAWREKAVSLVMAGGLMGAVVGPDLADAPHAPCWRVPFARRLSGAWPARQCCRMVAMALINVPAAAAVGKATGGRPLAQSSCSSRCSWSPPPPARWAMA